MFGGNKLIGVILTLAFTLAILYVYDTFVAKQEFDIMKSIVVIVVVLVAVGIGGYATQKIAKTEAVPKVTV